MIYKPHSQFFFNMYYIYLNKLLINLIEANLLNQKNQFNQFLISFKLFYWRWRISIRISLQRLNLFLY